MTSEQTKAIVAAMLRENVGSSFLDSGGTPQYDADGNYTGSVGGYGRAFERNQRRDFDAEPEAHYRVDCRGEIEAYRSVYHYITMRLDYDETWDDFYRWWLSKDKEVWYASEDNEDEALRPKVWELAYTAREVGKWSNGFEAKDRGGTHYLEDMEDFVIWLVMEGFEVAIGPYGETELRRGKHLAREVGNAVINTYNAENMLTQDIQFLGFAVNEVPEEYQDNFGLSTGSMILLQIHGGADARGGYTAPKLFSELGYDDCFGYLVADANLGCTNGHSWHTDDDYHWYANQDGPRHLSDYPSVDVSDLPEELAAEISEHFEIHPVEIVPPEQGELFPIQPYVDDSKARVIDVISYLIHVKGMIPYNSDEGILYCPICGERLEID